MLCYKIDKDFSMKEKVFIVFVEFRTIDHRFEGGGV